MSLLHEIALSCIPGVGSILARNLISRCGNAEDVFKLPVRELEKVSGIGPKTIAQIRKYTEFRRAEQEIEFIEKYKIQPLFIGNDRYPKRLKNCADAPVMLYFRGSADLNSSKVISIVGTRNATDYGKEICRTLLADLRVHDPLIVSGLAYGIDYAAHREALKNSINTIGVMAHGLDRVYPSQHRAIAEKMLKSGGLLTEFRSQTIPDRENFPKRNRIIAGLADVTIVVEASIKGGALITADIANSYNRDVFAYPGRANDEFSSGCNQLIKTNRAHLISKVSDLEYILNWTINTPSSSSQQLSLPVDLNEDEHKIFTVLSEKDMVAIDDLAIATGFSQSKLAMHILNMEMRGLVLALPGKTYKLA